MIGMMMPKHREVKQLIQGHTAGPKWPDSRAHLATTNRPLAQRTYLQMANSVTAESHMGLNPNVILAVLSTRRHCCCQLVAKSCLTFCDPSPVALQAPLSMGFPRHEH